jgi:hypothetical protein
VRAAQARKGGGDVGVLVDEAAAVIAQPDEATQLRVGGGDWPVAHGRNFKFARVHSHSRSGDPVSEDSEAELGATRRMSTRKP